MAVFVGLALAALLLDMVTHRDDKPITLARASIWSIFWVAISLAFAGFLYVQHGAEVASLFLTGYALEKVLSVDNLFVFMAIFAWFKVPDGLRHRILYWGIIGAIVFRGVFVVIGTGLLAFGPWVEIAFALIVAWTAVMMLKGGDDDDEEKDYSQHLACRLAKKLFPVWPRLHGHNFFVSRKTLEAEGRTAGNDKSLTAKGNLFATPLFLCLVVIEVSDVLFAFDSVPAVIAVSREPLIVYSAMLFAILGLRTLYFVLEALKRYVVHLEKAVVVLLFFIAAKLGLNATDHLFHHGISISPNTSLLIVLIVLAIGILASVIFPKKEDAQAEHQ
ncbi:Integral membrane protein TerC [Burkholderia lata]|uniref:Integral membrane protein TerC n=2 Tax=Burkholderia lata (strain ATCC 17760 / DSM 23089 / LMG 22485 / NCIMB 9086 / R18194 / 383) TaxID=482957 RepID=Q39AX4_BURL3|nr:Integral membrane protein TerC [Burkholderia lata]